VVSYALENRRRYALENRRRVMSQPDPWQRAAECEQAIRKTFDRDRRIALAYLKKLWVTLGDQKTFMTQRQLAEEIESIGELHTVFFGPDKRRLH
jgi:hypothetical protein